MARAWYGRARELAERLGDERHQASVDQKRGLLAHREAVTHSEGSEERRRLLGEAVQSVEAPLAPSRKRGDGPRAASSLFQRGVLHLDRAGLAPAGVPTRAEALARAEGYLLEGLAICEPLDHSDVWKDCAALEVVATARNHPEQAAACRARKDAQRSELDRLESGGAVTLPRQHVEALTALARAVHWLGQGRIAVPPGPRGHRLPARRRPAAVPGGRRLPLRHRHLPRPSPPGLPSPPLALLQAIDDSA